MNLIKNSQAVTALILGALALVGTMAYYQLPGGDGQSTVAVSPASLTAGVSLFSNIKLTPNVRPINSWPTSEQTLGYGGVVDSNVALNSRYFDNASDNSNIVTSFVVNNTVSGIANYHAPTALQNLYQTFHDANPDTLVGSYVSGGDCLMAAAVRYYFSNAITCEAILAAAGSQLAPSVLLPYQGASNGSRFSINIANPLIREAWANLLIAEGESRGLPFLYLDNIAHPSTGAFRGTGITFDDQMDLVTKVRIGLGKLGIRVVSNIALSPAGLTGVYAADADKMRMAAGDGGYSFEMPLHPSIRNKAADIAREIGFFRQLLTAGQLVLFVPAFNWPTLDDRLTDLQLIAAYAMMVKPAQDSSLFVAKLGYWLSPERFGWQYWPTLLGPATSDYRFASLNPVVLERSFARGILRVEPATREVQLSFYQPSERELLSDLDTDTVVALRADSNTESLNIASPIPPTSPIPPNLTPMVPDPIVALLPNKTLEVSYGAGGSRVAASSAALTTTPSPSKVEISAAVTRVSRILTDLIVYLQMTKKDNQKPDYAKVDKLLSEILQILTELKRYTVK